MSIILRTEELPSEMTIVVHLGAGDAKNLRDKAIRSYDDYRPLASDGLGLLVLSVYAAFKGRAVYDIADALPWKQYGTATVGEVGGCFTLLATTILGDNDDPVDELQAGR